MKLAIIGLGRMGGNMARRLARGGHDVVVYNRTVAKAYELADEENNVTAIESLDGLITMLKPPRVCWIMVPAGCATDGMIDALMKILLPGDMLIDGGNSFYLDSVRRAAGIAAKGVSFIDVGTSGGVWGLTEGYSMTVGGSEEDVDRLRPMFEALAPAPDRGWGHVGPAGSGHFVKMVHNGIEYGLMQAYAEGFDILKSKKEFSLDLQRIAEIWRYGSVVRSWLLDLTAVSLSDDPDLSDIKGWVDDSGQGRWAVAEAINEDVAAPVITLSLMMRFLSRQEDRYAAKLLAALRRKFGGHAVVGSAEKGET